MQYNMGKLNEKGECPVFHSNRGFVLRMSYLILGINSPHSCSLQESSSISTLNTQVAASIFGWKLHPVPTGWM